MTEKIGGTPAGAAWEAAEEHNPAEAGPETHRTADSEKPAEGQNSKEDLSEIASAFPQTTGKGQSEPSVGRLPQELIGEIAQHASLDAKKMMRLVSPMFRHEVNPTINAVKVTDVHDVGEARSVFNRAKHLTFKGDKLEGDHIDPKLLENLRSVSLLNTSKLTGRALARLPRGLKNQRIFNATNVKDEGLENLPPDLEVFSATVTGITDAGIAKIPRGVKAMALVSLSEGGGQITDAGIRNLPPDLKRLVLLSPNVTDFGMAEMPKNLEELELVSSEITGAAIRDVPKSVHTLSLPICKSVDAGIDDLSENVHTLTVPVGINRVPVGKTHIDVPGISDEAIARLPKTVKTLHLVGDDIPPERLQQLREQHKDLTITLESRKTLVNQRILGKARYFE